MKRVCGSHFILLREPCKIVFFGKYSTQKKGTIVHPLQHNVGAGMLRPKEPQTSRGVLQYRNSQGTKYTWAQAGFLKIPT